MTRGAVWSNVSKYGSVGGQPPRATRPCAERRQMGGFKNSADGSTSLIPNSVAENVTIRGARGSPWHLARVVRTPRASSYSRNQKVIVPATTPADLYHSFSEGMEYCALALRVSVPLVVSPLTIAATCWRV
jgi:hypothetical protein